MLHSFHSDPRQLPRGHAPCPHQWYVSCCGMLRIPFICCGCATGSSQITCLCVVISVHNRKAQIISHCGLYSAPWSMSPVHTAIDKRRVAHFSFFAFFADGWSACALRAVRCPSPSSWVPHLLHVYAHVWSPCACLLCVRFMMIFPVSSRPRVLMDQTLGYMTLVRHWSFPVCFLLEYTHCILCARRLEVI